MLGNLINYFNPLHEDFIFKQLFKYLNPFDEDFILKKLYDYLNPGSNNFILKGLSNTISDILSYINPFSENFFVYKLIELLGDLLELLFVPEENYFADKFDNLKEAFANRISYQSYIDIFENTKNVVADEQISIDMESYSVGTLKISKNKFIDFSVFDKYKQTYYGWVRGFTFVFLVLYVINHWYKLIRGVDLINFSNKGGGEK